MSGVPDRAPTALRTVRGTLAVGALTVLLVTGGCATQDTAGPSPSTGTSADPGTAVRVVVRADGTGAGVTTSLTCDPPGGDHPDPQGACGLLADGGAALRPVAPDAVCTQQYGGPQVAEISGTVAGEQVSATVTRTDGCEIARWDTLVPLVPRVR